MNPYFCTQVYASNARGKSDKVVIGNVAINAKEGNRGEQDFVGEMRLLR